jgi:glycosyltransferase involved in cell wall biosynthesis
MRIALASEVHAPKIDGISNRLNHTVHELISLGHEVLTITPAPAEPICDGERLLRLPGVRFPLYPDVVVGAPDPRILRELWTFRPHVMHAVGPVAVGVWALLAARALAIPSVASYHTEIPEYARRYGYPELESPAWKLLGAAHSLADLNLCPSRVTRDALVARGFRITGLWRGGVDPERFHPRKRSLAMRERLAGGPGSLGRPLLLCVGRLAAEKNLHALAPVLRELPGVRLAFVGDGPERARLARTYRGLPATFVGALTGEDLAAAYASADVFVLPSTTETLGFVVLEAMASGLPVVAAAAGGVRDLVAHDETGLLYDPAESKGALEPIRRLLGSRTLAEDLARRGRAWAERCSWRRETEGLVARYEFAIQQAQRRSLRAKLRAFLDA